VRRGIVVLTALATALALALPAFSAAETSGDREPYVVIMGDDPVVAYEGDIAGLPATKPDRGKKVNPNSAAVKNYQKHLDKQRNSARAGAGVDAAQVVNTYDFALAGFSALLTPAEAERLRLQKGVVSVVRDELRQLHTDRSPDFLGLTNTGGAYESNLTGEGVVVGIIDTGIWPEHPSFEDDGTLPEPDIAEGVPCEFGNTVHNPEDIAFDCTNKLAGARDMRALYNAFVGPELYDSARDADGHGSHTAGTAAGNADVEAEIFGIDRGTISGLAPRAAVIAYKGCGDLGCFGGDLADAIDQSVADGVDVINYSIGSTTPSLTGIDDIAFLFAADAGVFVATSNGNGGPGASTTGSPASVPWITSVGASHHDRMFQGSVVLGSGDEFFGASVTHGVGQAELVDAARLRNESCDPNVRFRPRPEGKIVLCKGAVQRAAKSRAVMEQGGVGVIVYNDVANQTLPSDNHYLPAVHVSNADGLAIKAYIASLPGTGRPQNRPRAEIIGGVAVERDVHSYMAYFSSRGPVGSPASADIIKPDVTAPGVQILAANSPAEGFDAPGELFMAIQGTSMSSPHAAGLFALLKQAHPEWSPAAAKSAMMTTARQNVFKEDQTTLADPFDMGAGHVDPSGPTDAPNSMFNPGIVYDAGFFEYLGFLCDAAPEVFLNPEATCAFVESLGVPTTTENLNYPSIGVSEVAGTKTITRTVTNVSGSSLDLTANVVAPDGYDVTVEPSNLVLAAGESASFDVTIDNLTAPLDEWRFGSLTWVGDGYAARSPIAVKAVQIEVPASVSGTGTEGEASFDVTFGYTGEYDAAAHGLEANSPIVGSVTQDPDQSFDPSDVGNGATAHDISLSGSLFYRITLTTADLTPPNSAIDLDLFLYKDGAQVAVSGAGSTNELIELAAPEDGDYVLYVHGWQTTGIEVGYSLNTWNVPSAEGGSLSVLSEPEDAVLGATETITVGWSGLEPGGQYLGAVSHHDGDSQIGLTLVEVSTE
jgi:subtilisin family serine protease